MATSIAAAVVGGFTEVETNVWELPPTGAMRVPGQGGSMILALTSRIRQPALIVLLHRWFDRRGNGSLDSPGAISPNP